MGFKNTDISSHLKLPPVKIHCSLLAEEAIHAAVTDYEAKKAKKTAGTEADIWNDYENVRLFSFRRTVSLFLLYQKCPLVAFA